MTSSLVQARMEALFSSRRNAHAYLFCGDMPSAKEAALSCAAIAIGAQSAGDYANPDLLVLDVMEGEQGISIDQVREVKRFLSLEPYFGNQRVVVVEQFERMKNEAAHALLKILEEPPEKSAIILLSSQSQLILGTILSRVQRIDFPHKTGAQDIDKKDEICDTLASVILAPVSKRFTAIQEIAESEMRPDLFDQWVLFFHDMLAVALYRTKDSLHYPYYFEQYQKIVGSARYSPKRIASILSYLIEYAHVSKTTNANKRLLLERIALLI